MRSALPTNAESDAPVWRQIERTLQGEINDGVWTHGSQLPNETVLAQRFGVNRHTVRRAMAALVQSGAVRIERGRGSFVQEKAILYDVGTRTRVDENLTRQHRGHTGRCLASFRMPASTEIAAALAVAVGEPLVVMDTLNESDGVPISLVRTYLPAARFADFPQAYEDTGHSMAAAFAKCGVPDFFRRSTLISARMPTKSECAHLMMAQNVPVIVSETTDVDTGKVPIKFGVALFPSTRVSINVAT